MIFIIPYETSRDKRETCMKFDTKIKRLCFVGGP